MDLAVNSVTLYKNNLGFLERKAHVAAGESASLLINDSIKDLFVSTLSVAAGDAPVTVSMGKPAAPKQEEKDPLYQFIYGEANLGEFLRSIVGTSVAVETEAQTYSGIVVMVEKVAQAVAGTDKTARVNKAVHILEEGSIRRILLEQVTNVRILDADTLAELARALASSKASRKPTKPPMSVPSGKECVTFRPGCEGDADLSVSYLDRAREWKCQYRCVR